MSRLKALIWASRCPVSVLILISLLTDHGWKIIFLLEPIKSDSWYFISKQASRLQPQNSKKQAVRTEITRIHLIFLKPLLKNKIHPNLIEITILNTESTFLMLQKRQPTAYFPKQITTYHSSFSFTRLYNFRVIKTLGQFLVCLSKPVWKMWKMLKMWKI